MIKYSEIKEDNGKTIKENNLELKHKLPIGAAVLYRNPEGGSLSGTVHSHNRDCDGTPLYGIQVVLHGINEDQIEDFFEWVERLKSEFK
jgi:hypothetical protein